MSPPAPNSPSARPASSTHGGQEPAHSEFSAPERSQLLRVAHESISYALNSRDLPFEPPSPHLAEARGVFTTLHLAGKLRGCVGYVQPTSSVYRAVAETARAAAFGDNRFSPVTREEAPSLKIELSVLSPPQPIQPEDIEVGHHGLLISQHGRRGLLLPQVAVEHHWDRRTFLDQTCLKAGLASDAWQKGALIEAFTAEIFGD